MRAAAIALVGLVACSDEMPAVVADAGVVVIDAGVVVADAGVVVADTGVIPDPLGTWMPLAALARGPRQETAVVALENEIYVIGGFDRDAQIVATVEAYDPTTDRWRDIALLPRPLHHANAAVVDGRLFVLGALGTGFAALQLAYEYERANDRWIDRTPLESARARGASACVVLDGMIYVIGGLRSGSVADADIYDPAADSWRPLPPLPRISDHLVGGAIDGRIYVAGGRSGGIGGHTDRLDIYDPSTGWSSGPAMPTSRAGSMAAVFGDRLFVFGGEGDSTSPPNRVFDDTESFDLSTNTWTVLAPMRTPRHGTGAATLGDRIYVPGGANIEAFAAVDTVEVYIPPPAD